MIVIAHGLGGVSFDYGGDWFALALIVIYAAALAWIMSHCRRRRSR